MKQSIDLPEGVLNVEVLTGRIIERDGLCIYGFKIWEMPNTACRLFAVEEAVKLGWERLDWVEEEYQERKQKKQKAA